MAAIYEVITDKKALSMVLILLGLSTLIDGLDATIVNVALPTMSQDFGITIADSSWIPMAYSVAMASLILPFAMIARNGWMKEFFIVGTGMFTVFSVLCGISNEYLLFIISRLMQGVGAAMVTASGPLMIAYLLPANHKGMGMAILGMTSGLAIVLGPTLGGIITAAVSWHWIFLINVPIGAVIVMLGLRHLPGTRNHTEYRYPDAINCILTFLCICCGLVFLQNVNETELRSFTVYICGAICLVSLAGLMLRSHFKKETAIISSSMLLRKDFALLCLAFTMTTIIVAGAEYVFPYYLEYVHGYRVSEVGYLISVASLATILLSFPVGKWCDSKGCKIPAVGAGVFRFLFTFIFAMTAKDLSFPLLIFGLVLMGISMACAGTGLATSIIHHSAHEHQDEAATFLMVINYTAASIGVAMTSLMYTINTSGTVSSSDVVTGFQDVMWFFVILSVVATICALVVPNIIPKKDEPSEKV